MTDTNSRSWVFQANPKLYDIDGALKHLDVIRWWVRQHKSAIQTGDLVYLWKTGADGGVVALATITDGPRIMPSLEEEKPFQKTEYDDSEQLSVVLHIDRVFAPPIPRQVFVDDPQLSSMSILRSPQGTNFSLTEAEAEAMANLIADSPATTPLESLTDAYSHFVEDPVEQLRIRVRRERARQLRELFDHADGIDVEAFNRDVWNLESSTLLNGEEVNGQIFGDGVKSPQFIEEVSTALSDGSLELHGNYIWSSGSRIYGSRLKLSPEERLSNIQAVLDAVTNEQIPPIEKAKQIEDISGFGPNMATGLVMVAHPEEFAIWNKPSKQALAKLGYDASELSRFQENAQKLKEAVGAKDFIELDLFLFRIAEAESSNDSQRLPASAASEGRSWAISLGRGGRLWKQCLKEGVISIGWDFLGDLKQYGSKEEIANAIAKNRKKDGPNPMNDSHCCYQFAYELKPGDRVFAKKGMNQLYGVGVIEAGYEYEPDRAEHHHIRRVRWELDGSWKMPDEARVPLKTLTEVTDYRKFQEFVATIVKDGQSHRPEPATVLEPYTISTALNGLFISESRFKEMLDSLSRKKNVILQGPPGVGKTYIAKRLAYVQIGEKDPSKVATVQFHQSYAYEDFIQGWRPHEGGGFERRDGVFHDFCTRASRDLSSNYVFVIDEINRGNLSKIFGELLMLIEADKRGPEFAIPLTYARDLDETFFVPSNVHIIGMMNTADRSLAMVDYALRRRFTFIDLKPAFESDRFREFLDERSVDPDVLEQILDRLSLLNEKIRSEKTNLGPGFEVGHSFFCPHDTEDELGPDWYRSVIQSEIAPLLREYWFDDTDKAEQLIAELLA